MRDIPSRPLAPAPTTRAHPALAFLLDAVEGVFPPADGEVTVVPPLPGGLGCSLAFTGHAVVATDKPEDEVRRKAVDGFGGSVAPDFLRWLAGSEGEIGCHDITLASRGVGDLLALVDGAPLPESAGLEAHPRVCHAMRWRSDVRVFADERGLVTLGTGLAGRLELSIEVSQPGRGAGRSLLDDGLFLVPRGVPVFAAVAPGNARSLRMFLAAGFVPLGSEVLVRPT